jgi:hypothetical protein
VTPLDMPPHSLRCVYFTCQSFNCILQICSLTAPSTLLADASQRWVPSWQVPPNVNVPSCSPRRAKLLGTMDATWNVSLSCQSHVPEPSRPLHALPFPSHIGRAMLPQSCWTGKSNGETLEDIPTRFDPRRVCPGPVRVRSQS